MDVLSRVGRIEQLAGIKRYTLNEGFERVIEVIEVEIGTGLKF